MSRLEAAQGLVLESYMSLQASYQFLLLLLLRLRPANTALHNNSCDLEFFEALWKEVLK